MKVATETALVFVRSGRARSYRLTLRKDGVAVALGHVGWQRRLQPQRRGQTGDHLLCPGQIGGGINLGQQIVDRDKDRLCHLPCDAFEMALDENHGYNQLNRDNRHDQDQRGAAIKAAGKRAAKPGEGHGATLAPTFGERKGDMTGPAPWRPLPRMLQVLEPGLRCILAGNPSALTGPGTNSYLIGARDLVVIDPGPDDPRHHAALLDAVPPGGAIRQIIVTHPHLDHSAGTLALAWATGAPVMGFGDAYAGLGVTGSKRAQAFKDMPTIAESGYPGFVINPCLACLHLKARRRQ